MNLSEFINRFNKKTLEERIFITILLMSITTAGVSIAGNLIIGLPLYINIKWLIIIIFSFISIKHLNNSIMRMTYFLFLIYIFIPLGWIDSRGGCSLIGYLFLICICICILFKGKNKLFLFFSIILVFTILITFYTNHPLLLNYDDKSYYMDSLVQVPLTLIMTFIFLNIFASAYNKEKNILKKYSDELAVTNEKLKKISITDSLTGFYNRKEFFNRLQESIYSKKQFCILMLDIDNFKNINDNYGHMVGDTVITEICQIIKGVYMHYGQYGRYGGDEFILVIHLNLKNSAQLCNVFLETLRNSNNLSRLNVTISGGLIQYDPTMSLLDLLKNADERLYQAKKLGKNQIYPLKYTRS